MDQPANMSFSLPQPEEAEVERAVAALPPDAAFQLEMLLASGYDLAAALGLLRQIRSDLGAEEAVSSPFVPV